MVYVLLMNELQAAILFFEGAEVLNGMTQYIFTGFLYALCLRVLSLISNTSKNGNVQIEFKAFNSKMNLILLSISLIYVNKSKVLAGHTPK